MNYTDEIETLVDRLAEAQPLGWYEWMDFWQGIAEYLEMTATNIRSAVSAHEMDREYFKTLNATGEDSLNIEP
jgi:hypothetical protein